jgi:hypothetical protein
MPRNSSTEADVPATPETPSAPVAEVAPLRADVAQAVDEYWPLQGEDWQVKRSLDRRESLKTFLATIIK